MKKLIVITAVGIIGLFFFYERGEKPLSISQMEQRFYERGEKPLSMSQMEQRLLQAGFKLEPQEKLQLYPDQEALFPEKPGTIRTFRLHHSDGSSTVITAASFSNEKISHSLKGKTRGFPSRNWFFLGGIDLAMTRQVQEALKSGEDDLVFRLKVSDAEPKPPVSSTPSVRAEGENIVVEEILTRKEVLERFESAGLTIIHIEENKGMPSSVKRKLPVEPLDDFLLIIENEGVFPIEFKTPEDAIKMHQKYKKGFRHGNWYFPGQITSGLRNRLVSALRGN